MADPRDPDLIQIIAKLQGDLDELTKNVIARSGRVPHVAADPASPPDGGVWVRSDTGEWRYRANGATIALDARYVPIAGGVILTDAAQTTTTGVAADISWGTEISDPDAWHVAASTILTVPAGKGGRYLVTFSGIWNIAFAGGSSFARVNGVAYQGAVIESNGFHTLTFLTTLNVGDTLEFRVIQNSGGNRDVVSRLEIAPV